MDTRAIFMQTFWLEVKIACGIFVAVTGTLAFALWHYRAREGRAPVKKNEFPRIEQSYIILVATIAAFLLANSLIQNGKERRASRNDPAVSVLVTGYQWCWKFHYIGTPVVITGNCLADRGPTMWLPQGKPVKISVTTADVVHELWIPEARFKEQALPHHINSFVTIFKTRGYYHARCAAFCGVYHYSMVMQVRIVADGEYKAWLAKQVRLIKARGALVGTPTR